MISLIWTIWSIGVIISGFVCLVMSNSNKYKSLVRDEDGSTGTAVAFVVFWPAILILGILSGVGFCLFVPINKVAKKIAYVVDNTF